MTTCWKGGDGMTEPEQRECESFGWPNCDSTGETMYNNVVFATEAEAWDSILRSVSAGVKLAGAHVKDCWEKLAIANTRSGEAAIEYVAAHDKHRAWLAKRAGTEAQGG